MKTGDRGADRAMARYPVKELKAEDFLKATILRCIRAEHDGRLLTSGKKM
jgi:hypothetical protein